MSFSLPLLKGLGEDGKGVLVLGVWEGVGLVVLAYAQIYSPFLDLICLHGSTCAGNITGTDQSLCTAGVGDYPWERGQISPPAAQNPPWQCHCIIIQGFSSDVALNLIDRI